MTFTAVTIILVTMAAITFSALAIIMLMYNAPEIDWDYDEWQDE